MALTSIFITAYETRADSFWKRLSGPVSFWNAQTLPKPRRNIQLIMPAQELYYVASLLNKLFAYNIKYHSYYLCKEERKREREREKERERERATSVNLHCYCLTAGSFILNFKEALLKVADIKRRDEFIHNSRVEIH